MPHHVSLSRHEQEGMSSQTAWELDAANKRVPWGLELFQQQTLNLECHETLTI